MTPPAQVTGLGKVVEPGLAWDFHARTALTAQPFCSMWDTATFGKKLPGKQIPSGTSLIPACPVKGERVLRIQLFTASYVFGVGSEPKLIKGINVPIPFHSLPKLLFKLLFSAPWPGQCRSVMAAPLSVSLCHHISFPAQCPLVLSNCFLSDLKNK